MNGILIYRNYAREAAAVTASSTLTGYHVNNVRDDVLGTVWQRSGTGASSYITFDLGTATALTVWAIVGLVNIAATGMSTATLKVGSVDNGSTFDTTVATMYPHDGIPHKLQTFTVETKRYWRVLFASGAGPFEIGEIVLGRETTFAECPDAPMGAELFDQVVTAHAEGGAEIVEIMGNPGMQVELNWSNVSSALGVTLPVNIQTYLKGRAVPTCFASHNAVMTNPYECRFCRVVACKSDEVAPGDRYRVRLVLKDVV